MQLKRVAALSLVLGATVLAAILVGVHHASAGTAAGISASSDVADLPQRPDIQVRPLASADGGLAVDASYALTVAENRFGLVENQFDQNAGAVAGVVSIRGSQRFHDVVAWILTANVDVMGQSPLMPRTVYHKLCIVIDATTGHFLFAYTADAQQLGQ